jgi:acetate CoA/acetoacetate CoA-transferase beta subunit
MTHTARGAPKLVKRCAYPITSTRRVDLIVTELAVIEPVPAGLVLRETAPGVTVDQVVSATGAHLIVPSDVHEMCF